MWLSSVTNEVAELRGVEGVDLNNLIGEFKTLDASLPLEARKEIRRVALGKYSRHVTVTEAGELGVLRNQLSRRRRQMPIRTLLQRVPVLSRVLKPCFMMSPLAVSQFLPRAQEQPIFDVLIIDEASQVFPEDAIPAISRAKQLIVVGDSKQLPPTSFFRRLGDDAFVTDDFDEEEETDSLEGRDSILEAMLGRALGTVAIEGSLNVHYRSKHET